MGTSFARGGGCRPGLADAEELGEPEQRFFERAHVEAVGDRGAGLVGTDEIGLQKAGANACAPKYAAAAESTR
jgi:hypothetical protein